MTPFLKQVADAYYRRGGLEKTCFIFPNRRAMVFFKKYLADANQTASAASQDAEAPQAGRPILMPRTCTVNDFMASLYDGVLADRTDLLLDLYEIYSKLNKKAETLDEFIYWGDVLLGDFNDADKYMVDTKQLFTNVSDYKAIQDNFSYLTEEQRKAMEKFAGHFITGSPVKDDFLRIWNLLLPLYNEFRKTLSDKGLAYEGMIYREVADRMVGKGAADLMKGYYPDTGLFVFVGLNALNECEKTVLRKLRDASMAEFCWDYEGKMIKDPYNRSSHFMSKNVVEFPQALSFEPVSEAPEIRVISVASSVGQAKLLPSIFSEIAETAGSLSSVGNLRYAVQGTVGADCAVVLPDENLLVPVLSSIPPEIAYINVTMGYPMTGSTFYSFMTQVAALQLNVRSRSGASYYSHKYLFPIFSSAIFKKVATEEDLAEASRIKAAGHLYIAPDELTATPLLRTLFAPKHACSEVRGPEEARAEEEGTRREAVGGPPQTLLPQETTGKVLPEYLIEVAETIGILLKRARGSDMELEFAKSYIDCVKHLKRKHLDIKPKTWIHLLTQLLSGITVPFHGEPLRGLQIMGPLETRALDFDHLIILSVNEGVFPRRSVSNSFIPPELRRSFGLPTYEYQDAVWAYYFYRLISRAKKVWLLCDSRTEGLKSGEESRYIKQLEYHFNLPLKRVTVGTSLSLPKTGDSVEKTAEAVEKIKTMKFSATALQKYLACPAQFYYSYVEKLKEEDELVESLDTSMIGKIYHAVMQAIYTGDKVPTYIDKGHITRWLRSQKKIKAKIDSLIMAEIHSFEVSGRDLVTAEVILKYVLQTLRRDLELIEDHRTDGFWIYGLEKLQNMEIAGLKFQGYLDRLDSFDSQTVRIVDYKTGKVSEEVESITDENAVEAAEQLFDRETQAKMKIALQLYIYDRMLRQSGEFEDRKMVNCIYSPSKLFTEKPKDLEICPVFCEEVDRRLEILLNEILDTDIPFSRTDDEDTCSYCDFKSICGR